MGPRVALSAPPVVRTIPHRVATEGYPYSVGALYGCTVPRSSSLWSTARLGVPAKPDGFVGKGGARERVELSPQAEAERSGLCDDAVQNRFLSGFGPGWEAGDNGLPRPFQGLAMTEEREQAIHESGSSSRRAGEGTRPYEDQMLAYTYGRPHGAAPTDERTMKCAGRRPCQYRANMLQWTTIPEHSTRESWPCLP